MYAVIETGGKQYRVEVGTQLEVELLDVEPGKTITLDRVLLVADGDQASIGQPVVSDAQVSAEVVSQIRGPKTISFKYRPKARSRVKKGHRQELTVLRISDIVLGGKSAAADSKKAADAAKTERARLEEAAAAQAAKDADLAAKLAASAEPAKPAKASAPKSATSKAPTAKAEAKTTSKTPTAKADAAPTKAATAAKKPATKAASAAKKPAAKAKTSSAAADAKADAPAKKSTRATKKDE
jgi:large subunit ribosomal protein L21